MANETRQVDSAESTMNKSSDNSSRSVSRSTWDEIKGAVENFAGKPGGGKDLESLDLFNNDLYQTKFDAFNTHQDAFGNEIIDLPGGGKVEKDRVVNTDGKVERLESEPVIKDDGRVVVKLTNDGEDRSSHTRIYHESGKVENFRNNGDHVIDYPNGTREVRDHEGGQTFFYPDKSIEKMRPNGEVIRISPEGKKEVIVEHDDRYDEKGTLDEIGESIDEFFHDLDRMIFD